MKNEFKKTDWNEMEAKEVTMWYKVQSIMGFYIGGSFPGFTYRGLTEEIVNDKTLKKQKADPEKGLGR